MIKRLRRNFIIVNMAIVTVMLAVILGLVLFFTGSNMERDSVQLLRTASMRPMQHDMRDDAPQKMPPFVFTVYRTPTNEYAAMGSEVIDFSDSDLLSEIFNRAVGAKAETGVLEEYSLRFQISREPMKNAVYFIDISAEKETLRQLSYTCIFIAVISFGVFLIISIILARWTVKPVETAWEQQKQFVADASHELKTPLTVIMTNGEMLLEGNPSLEKRTQFTGNILIMAKQMRGLIESLLELARSDNNSKEEVFTKTDFSSLVSEALLPFEPLYFEKGLELSAEIQENIAVLGDSASLLRLTDILLDNAMKYSYPGTAVRVSLKRQRECCILSVESHGDTLSGADLKNIFKRFYRVDKARSMNHSYGLGLPIAESIVEKHKEKIRAESVSGVNTFRVRLPLA